MGIITIKTLNSTNQPFSCIVIQVKKKKKRFIPIKRKKKRKEKKKKHQKRLGKVWCRL